MSNKSIAGFYNELVKNEKLKTEFRKIISDGKDSAGNKIPESEADKLLESKVIPFAKKAGFEFTLAELKEYAKNPPAAKVADDELTAVAGGVSGIGAACGCINGGGGGDRDKPFDDGSGSFICGCIMGGGGGGGKTNPSKCVSMMPGAGQIYPELDCCYFGVSRY